MTDRDFRRLHELAYGPLTPEEHEMLDELDRRLEPRRGGDDLQPHESL
jgi:hypothetical protein